MGASIDAAIASTTAEITDVFTGNIGLILAVFAGFVAVSVAVFYVRKFIGRK